MKLASFTRALQYFLSWAESTQSHVLIPIYWRSVLILYSHLRLGFPKNLFAEGLPVKIVKELLPSSILATWPAHLNVLDLITLTILGVNGITNYEVHFGTSSTPHSHFPWVQMFVSGACFRIPLACNPPLI